MTTYTISVEESPQQEDVAALAHGLSEHGVAHTRVPGFQPIGAFLRDESGNLAGGIWGYLNWNWLFVGLFWISDAGRGRGYGKQLIGALEQAARARGSHNPHNDTFT